MASWRPGPRLRRAVIARARGRCEYCHAPAAVSTDSFAVDHIIPVVTGGGHDPENLALACGGCNAHKGAASTGTDTVTGEEVLLFHPRRSEWRAHFTWAGLLIVGLTPAGRATVTTLAMNREPLLNLRTLFDAVGRHPPE